MAVIAGKNNAGLVKYAQAQLGRPYWYGTFGNIATASLYEYKKKQYASTGYYTKWKDYSTQYGKRVHDCVGLIKGYIWSDTPTSVPKYNAAQDKSASGMYSASTVKGKIDTFPMKEGQLVYKSYSKSDAKQIHHVGVYVGGGYVIEAMTPSSCPMASTPSSCPMATLSRPWGTKKASLRPSSPEPVGRIGASVPTFPKPPRPYPDAPTHRATPEPTR